MVALDGPRRPRRGRPRRASARVRVPGHRGPGQPRLDGARRPRGRGRPRRCRWTCGSRSASRRRPAWAAGRATRPPRWWPPTACTGSASARTRLEAVAARVGSDVPFFVRGGAQWAEGRGERLRPAARPGSPPCSSKADGGALHRRGLRAPSTGCRRPPRARRASRPRPARPRGLGCATTSGPRRSPWRPASAPPPAPWRAAGAGAVLLCGSGSCLAGLFPDRAGAEAAARTWPARGFRAVVDPAPEAGRIAARSGDRQTGSPLRSPSSGPSGRRRCVMSPQVDAPTRSSVRGPRTPTWHCEIHLKIAIRDGGARSRAKSPSLDHHL